MPYTDPEKQREARRASYERNRDKTLAAAAIRKQDKFVKLREIKESSPCVDCKEQYPYYVMQFDHIGSDKVANVGKLVRGAGWDKVLAEIEKCELVCANCHAARSWKRLQAPIAQ